MRPPAFAILFTLSAAAAFAEPATAVQSSGDPSNRLDLVIVGDGYTVAELGKFATDVTVFLTSFFVQEPWAEYRPIMNVYRVDVASAQSGASHPESGTIRSTAFSAAYNCAGEQRLICVNISAVSTVVARSVGPAQHDLVIVLVNDPAYGGSGGAVSVASLHTLSVELALHEIGHTLGLLGDEYTFQPPPCTITSEPPFANVTVQTARGAIKWNAWIDSTTPLPTSTTSNGVPGIYLGAHYCPSGVYRPTYNSKMRSLGRPYEQINSEQLIRRFYNFVTPLDAFSPAGSTVAVPAGGSTIFHVNAPAPATHTDTITWQIDGAIVATGASLSISAEALSPGSHTLTAVIRDLTPMVRSDPSGVLQTTHSWTISGGVGLAAPNPPLGLTASASGSVIMLSWTAPDTGAAPSEYVVEAGSGPGLADLATFSTGNAATVFTASGIGAGRYYVRLRSANAAGRSAPSAETLLIVGGACGAAPSLSSRAVGSTVTLQWTATAGASAYQLEAGSAPGSSDLVNVDTGGAQTTFTATGVGAGTYFVRVRANTSCGRTAPSNEVVVVVR